MPPHNENAMDRTHSHEFAQTFDRVVATTRSPSTFLEETTAQLVDLRAGLNDVHASLNSRGFYAGPQDTKSALEPEPSNARDAITSHLRAIHEMLYTVKEQIGRL